MLSPGTYRFVVESCDGQRQIVSPPFQFAGFLFKGAKWPPSHAALRLAYKGRILSISMDGAIPELPSTYQTTRLHIAFSEGDAGALQKLDFLSSGRETSVQPCLLRLVPNGSFHQLVVKGSWYHDESILPHYLDVQFLSSQPTPPINPGVHFLFSLRDARLFEVTEVVPAQVAGQPQIISTSRNIPLSDGCPA
jgi:hypothetical protein